MSSSPIAPCRAVKGWPRAIAERTCYRRRVVGYNTNRNRCYRVTVKSTEQFKEKSGILTVFFLLLPLLPLENNDFEKARYCKHRLYTEFIIIIIINPKTARVVGAPQMILQPVFSIFPCSPLPSGTWRTPGLSIPRCCLPTSSFVRLVFFPISLCLARWFWPDLMNGRHDHTTAVCVSLRPSGDLQL